MSDARKWLTLDVSDFTVPIQLPSTTHCIVSVRMDDNVPVVITCACGSAFNGWTIEEARERYDEHRPTGRR